MLLRTLTLIPLLAITGCKVVIEVPAGGRVVSDSGTYDCATGVTCVIDITDTRFEDTFTAVPDPGFRFVGWERGNRHFCGGLREPCALSTRDFGDNEALLAQLDSDNRYLMNPQFEPLVTPDYNGDGYADAAVFVRSEDSDIGRGAIQIIYGGAEGLRAKDNQLLSPDGVFGASGELLGFLFAESLDAASLSSGDFNGDGFTDLVIGRRLANNSSGEVMVLPGSENGITPRGQQRWDQSGGQLDRNGDGNSDEFLGDIFGGPEAGDEFGRALISGDFDKDGFDDLAIGVAGEAIGDVQRAGAVNVIYGSATGLQRDGEQFLSQGQVGRQGDIIGTVDTGDQFGFSLAAGDLTGDGIDDLVVGSPFEDFNSVPNAGIVSVITGSASGLTAAGNYWVSQDTLRRDSDGDGSEDGAASNPTDFGEPDDRFGISVDVADVDGDGFADLVVGIDAEQVISTDGEADASTGAVQVFLTDRDGLRANDILVTPPSLNWLGSPDTRFSIEFGRGLLTADIDQDGCRDLLISGEARANEAAEGISYLTVWLCGSQGPGTGGINWLVGGTLYGEDGVARSGDLRPLPQNVSNLPFATGDYNGDGYPDVLTGFPEEPVGLVTNAGAVLVTFGNMGGLETRGAQIWSQDGGMLQNGLDLGDLLEEAESGDSFGDAVH